MLAEAVLSFLEGGGIPAWNSTEERKDIAKWFEEADAVCVYQGDLRHGWGEEQGDANSPAKEKLKKI